MNVYKVIKYISEFLMGKIYNFLSMQTLFKFLNKVSIKIIL